MIRIKSSLRFFAQMVSLALAILVVVPPAVANPAACTVPGLQKLTDPSGDSTSGIPGTDLLSFWIAQPPSPTNTMEEQLLAFRINISPGATPSAANAWYVSFFAPSGILGVRMTGDESGNPVFQSYVVGASNSGARDGRFVASTKPAHPSSTFNAAAGTITIFVKATDLGFTAAGPELSGFNSGMTISVPGLLASMADEMPNGLARTGTYVLADNTACGSPALTPLAPPGPASGLAPRYQIHVAQPGLGNDAAEPSVGFNPFTQKAMFIAFTQALRMTFQETVGLPVACDAVWEDKSGLITTANSLDPLLFTDMATGRTFNSQLSGANSLFEFTDDDGENWTVGQIGIPNGGADHQTTASGLYPAGLTPPAATWPPAPLAKRAVYYCSQSVVGAFCSRSDDGGLTFGPGFPFKNTECSVGALHGHVKVAPDGTVYVPDSSQCILPVGPSAEKVVAFVSTDAGLTFEARPILTSSGGASSDPSIGIATDGTAYMCYENGNGRVHMAVSHDRGLSWENDQDIGLADAIVYTRFPQSIAGDRNRASCAFLGTTTAAGDPNSLSFQGVWYPYVATTYDGGLSWHLINTSPNDPVQGHGGVGPSGTNRNLLDFNDLQIDDKGRTYFALADGCIGGCVQDPSANSFAAKAVVIRQTGGRTLFSTFDDDAGTQYNSVTPIVPAAACVSQTKSIRTAANATIVWNAPDTGGSPITNYEVYRSTELNGTFVLLGNAGASTQFVDTTVSAFVPDYYYRVVAMNAQGVAPVSNTILLQISLAPIVNTCIIPGEVIAVDSVGDHQGTADMDIVSIAVAEPVAFANAFVITEKIADFTTDQPLVDSFYPILFPSQGNKYISLDSTQGSPKFTHGTYVDVANGVLSFTEVGLLPGSSFAANGTITLVVPRSLFNNPAVGSVIAGFDARARIGAQSANSRDTAGPSDYTVRGTAICNAALPVAQALEVDTLGNGVLEAGETATVTPSWKNVGVTPLALTGTLAGFTGPAGPTYTISSSAGDYGTIQPDATAACSTCYGVSIAGSRPAAHWDTSATETLSVLTDKVWIMHVGDSFIDAGRSNLFYQNIETILHYGVTLGCGNGQYCPLAPSARAQMAAFLARSLTGGDALVPNSGTARGSAYNCSANGNSLFSDVGPTSAFCKHIHYIYDRRITEGCSAGVFCPAADTPRDQMAIFIARVLLSPNGDAAVPAIYTDPTSNRSYNCTDGNANFFSDVPDSFWACKQIHYVWATEIVDGFVDGTYRPSEVVSRGQMSKFLANAFEMKLYKP